MSTGMDGICDDLVAESADLTAILATLTDERWDADTPADGWTIRDQVSHLAYFDETGTLAATDADAFVASSKSMLADPKAMDIPSDRGRAMSPAGVLDWFTTVRAQMIRVFRSLDAKARLPWYGPPMSAMSFATARLMETWAHGQDIADTLGIVRAPTDRLRHVAHIGVRARPFSYATNGREMPGGEIGVTLTAPSGAIWSWNEGETANTVTGPALDFCLVVTQRRHPADTALVVSGPLAQDWIAIAQAFAGPPGTGREAGQFAG
jgi:uncharacterized protein (TIGR03084 family)